MRNDTRRRWIGLLLALACIAGLTPAARAQVNVPAGSAIVVTLDQSVSSKDARTGQRLDGTRGAGRDRERQGGRAQGLARAAFRG